MYKLKIFSTLIGLSFLLLNCGDGSFFDPADLNPSTPNTTEQEGTMTAKVDGTNWTATLPGAFRVNGVINIGGQSQDESIITITMEDKGTGTYTLGKNTLSAAAYAIDNTGNSISYTSNSDISEGGEVIISDIDEDNKTMSGSFSFMVGRELPMEGTKRLTEGVFDKIPYQTELAPLNNGNSLSVVINGELLEASTTVASASSLLDNISISANNSPTGFPSIGLFMPNDVEPGTYEFSFGGDYSGLYNASTDPAQAYSADSGELVITKHDTGKKELAGTFHFEATALLDTTVYQIKEGVFSVTY